MSKRPGSAGRLVCTRAFSWLEVHPGGAAFVCCPAWRTRPLGNLLEQTLDEIWNGPAALNFRAALLRGDFQGCSGRCPRRVTSSDCVGRSAEIADPHLREMVLAGRTRLETGPSYLNLCFDPRCNLSCPSCRATDAPLNSSELERLETLQRRIVTQILPAVQVLTVAGYGDPFGSPAYRELLGQLSPQTSPQLREVRLHTNALLWNRARWRRWPWLHGLIRRAEISVDAASPATYALNRRGGEFAVLLQNLAFIADLDIEVLLSFVVQANNFREMENFADLARGFGWRCYFSRLVNWGSFARSDYAARAVHQPGHPEHPELVTMLRRLHQRPDVELGNLLPLLAAPSAG